MKRPLQKKILLDNKTITASGWQVYEIPFTDQFDDYILEASVANTTGQSPTLDLYWQQSLDGGTTWLDIVRLGSFITDTASNIYFHGGDGSYQVSHYGFFGNALGDGTAHPFGMAVLLSDKVRLKWVVGAVSSFDVSVKMYYA